MKVTFENKNNGRLWVHEEVSYMQAGENCFGRTGWGLHFVDNTYCLIDEETFRLIAASI